MGKKIAMFIAFQGFRDEEYVNPRRLSRPPVTR